MGVNSENKFRRLSTVVLFNILIAILLLSVAIGIVGYVQFTKVLQQQYNDEAYVIAETARTYLNPDELEGYLATGEADESFNEVQKRLDELTITSECNFIYVASIDPTDFLTTTYIFDSVNPALGFDRYPLGYTSTDGDPKYVDDLKHILETGGRAEKYLYSYTEYGAHTTAGLGVKDSTGKVVAVIGVEKTMSVLNDARKSYLVVVALITAVFLALAVSISWIMLKRNVVNPIIEITQEAERFAVSQIVSVDIEAEKNKSEIGLLAKSIKKMEQDINDYVKNLTTVTAEKERISTELNMATEIQTNMLPNIFPDYANREDFTIRASMNPAKEVGGDFYDFFFIDESHLALVMADVSGKGVPAALFMVISKTLIKSAAQLGGKSPSKILAEVNNQLAQGNDTCYFVTVWLGIVDLKTGEVVECNAGHECPAIKRVDGDFELRMTEHDVALGVMENMTFADYKFILNKGDRLFLYTDGVPEATNIKEELFSEKRMLEALNSNKDRSLEELLSGQKAAIDAFVMEADQFDDITMMAFELK